MSEQNAATIKKKFRLPKPVSAAIIGTTTLALLAYTAYGVSKNDLVIPMSYRRPQDLFRHSLDIHFSNGAMYVVAAALLVIIAELAYGIVRILRLQPGEKMKTIGLDIAALLCIMLIGVMCIANRLTHG